MEDRNKGLPREFVTNQVMKRIFIVSVLSFMVFSSLAQDILPLVLNEETSYFNFWEGDWVGLKDDGNIDTSVFFSVRRGVHPASFQEEWGTGKNKSLALRAWDKTNSKWGFVWVSSNGLFQVWDSKKFDGHWYILKNFDINGDKYLSRQGFIPQPDGTVLRISEKSYDEKTWQLRFKQRLKKIKR